MRVLLAVGLLVALALAGCSSGGGGETPGNEDKLDVDAATGGIRGVIVDQAISPVAGAVVTITGGLSTESASDGTFNFTRLQPGEYLVTVGKPGFKGAQTSTTVVAGDPEPKVVKLLIERLSTATPFFEHYKLDGYYECAYAVPFQTDGCDWGYRTAWDELNNSGNPPPTPRTVQRFSNTQYIAVSEDTYTIIQEGFWDNSGVTALWIMIDETPIANDCDCSPSYGNRIGPAGVLNRLDRYTPDGAENTNFTTDQGSPIGEFPTDKLVASRGFLPFGDPQYALNFQFTVITTLFHNYVPDQEWTFQTKENFPVG